MAALPLSCNQVPTIAFQDWSPTGLHPGALALFQSVFRDQSHTKHDILLEQAQKPRKPGERDRDQKHALERQSVHSSDLSLVFHCEPAHKI